MTGLAIQKTEGIKELQEALDVMFSLSLHMTSILKDGYQASDIPAIIEVFTKDEEFKKKFSLAMDGIGKVPEELKDLDFKEKIEIAVGAILFVPKFVEVLRKGKTQSV